MKKVRPGQPLQVPAGTFNTFIDAAQDFLDRTRGRGQGATPGGPSRRFGGDTGRILVRNDSGATVDRFGILGVDTIVITPTANADEFRNRPILSVIAPAVPDHSEPFGKFVILAEPLRHEATVADRPIGEAVIDGVTPVLIDVQDADHEFAVVVNAQSTKLESAVTGPVQIIYKESGTGDKWAVVRLGGNMEAAGGASAALTCEKWYDIQANKVWTDIDTRDWSGRFLKVAAQYKPDSGNAAGIQWEEALVEHYNTLSSSWVGQATNEWFRLWLKDGGAAQGITRIDQAADTDFHLQMDTNGRLQIKVENHSANMQVRFTLRAGEKILNTDAEAIT